MAEIRGEGRHEPLHVATLLIPGYEASGGEGVSQILEPWATAAEAAIDLWPQTGCLTQLCEGPADRRGHEPPPSSPDEEGRRLPVWEDLVTTLRVGHQSRAGGSFDGNKPGLAELGLANGKDVDGEVDIAEIQGECLSGPEAGRGEETHKGGVGPTTQPAR